MTITVRSAKDVRLAHRGRYFLIRDADGVMRVVSASKLTELSPYVDSSGGRRYKYAVRAGGYQNSWGQAEIAGQFNNPRDTVQATGPEVNKLQRVGAIQLAGEAVASASSAPTTGQFGGGYVIASVVKGSGALSFANLPKVHATSESAEAEAERLASIDPGKEFVVFKATMSAIKANVVTRKF